MITCHCNQLSSLNNSYFAYLLNWDNSISKFPHPPSDLSYGDGLDGGVLPRRASRGYWLSHSLVSLPSTTEFIPEPLHSCEFLVIYSPLSRNSLFDIYKSLYELAPGQMSSLLFVPLIPVHSYRLVSFSFCWLTCFCLDSYTLTYWLFFFPYWLFSSGIPFMYTSPLYLVFFQTR